MNFNPLNKQPTTQATFLAPPNPSIPQPGTQSAPNIIAGLPTLKLEIPKSSNTTTQNLSGLPNTPLPNITQPLSNGLNIGGGGIGTSGISGIGGVGATGGLTFLTGGTT